MARILIACEFSGVVREAFRKLGHDAFSCDILPAEDGSQYHLQGDVLDYLDDGWDMMIAHPPCTYLAVSGLHWNKRVEGRAEKTEEALEFVRKLMDAPIPMIAVENPVSCISSRIRKPDQIIQPFDFGHDASKKTCLWLKNLPPIEGTEFIPPTYVCKCGHHFPYEHGNSTCPECKGATGRPKMIWANQTPSGQNKLGPSPERQMERSRTYQGIADAMASQWSDHIERSARETRQ